MATGNFWCVHMDTNQAGTQEGLMKFRTINVLFPHLRGFIRKLRTIFEQSKHHKPVSTLLKERFNFYLQVLGHDPCVCVCGEPVYWLAEGDSCHKISALVHTLTPGAAGMTHGYCGDVCLASALLLSRKIPTSSLQ